MFCGDRDESINHIIRKLAQKECKTRYNSVGKVIHGKFCKKLKLWPMMWYMHTT